MDFPNNKKFAFTIIDDTDDAFLENIQPIYDFLFEKGLRTTKTVWVYPVRDHETSKGDSLQRLEYLEYIKLLKRRGFEIALHNVGSGAFQRNEIIQGLNDYKDLLGEFPKIHINHSYNPDNIYSGEKRFVNFLRPIIRRIYPQYADKFAGEIEGSEYFWGDYHKSIIKYNRNYEFDQLNIIKKNPEIPYKDTSFDKYSNYWFSAAFAPNQWVFNHIVNKKSIDNLEKESGVCILYTHFGYYMYEGNKIDPGFKDRINYLSSKNGWFVPVSEILDFLLEQKEIRNSPEYIKYYRKALLSISHLFTRIKYRKFIKIDDYYFKQKYP